MNNNNNNHKEIYCVCKYEMLIGIAILQISHGGLD